MSYRITTYNPVKGKVYMSREQAAKAYQKLLKAGPQGITIDISVNGLFVPLAPERYKSLESAYQGAMP